MPKAIYHNLANFFEKNFLILPTILVLYWACFQFYTSSETKSIYGNVFGILIAIVALIASLFSFIRSLQWEFFESYLGKSLFFISLALLAWSLGQTLFLMDSFKFNTPINYDNIFVFIDPLYLIGIYFISKSLSTFKNFISNFKLIVIPIFIFLINIFFVSQIRNEQIINSLSNIDFKLLFIFGSILLSSFVISILVISGKKIGGKFKSALYFILIGLLLQYLADNLFEVFPSFQTNGSLSDLIFMMSILAIFYGTIQFNPRSLK